MKSNINIVLSTLLLVALCLTLSVSAQASVISFSISSTSGDSWFVTFDVSNTIDPIWVDTNSKAYMNTLSANGDTAYAADYLGSSSEGYIVFERNI